MWGGLNWEASPRDFLTLRFQRQWLQGSPWLHGQPLWVQALAVSHTLPLPTQIQGT
jgi:hypothetical protein